MAQIELWQDLWGKLGPEQRREATQVWHKTLPVLTKARDEGRMWGSVAGPLRATMATLLEQGWQPHHPAVWTAPCAKLEANNAESASAADLEIAQHVRRAAEAKVWRQAAAHYRGEGLQHGTPSIKPLRNALAWLKKRGLREEAAALSTAACGGSFFGQRLGEAECKCHACGGAVDNPIHSYWECSGIRRIPDIEGAIAKSNCLSETTRNDSAI